MGSVFNFFRRKDPSAAPFSSRKEGNKNLFFQPKLTVGPTDDVYEREADSMADRVMRMSDEETIQTKISPVDIQRKCAQCDEEEEVQRKDTGKNNGQTEAPGIVSRALQSGGQALDDGTRSFMENRFGYDFSGVKVHTDTVAAKSAESINALAYTSGDNIVFNEGQYAPGTDNGKRLLAHELTHVVQQKGSLIQRTISSNPDCGSTTALPISDSAFRRRGASYTETFTRPASGSVHVRVTATASEDCHHDNTFGVNVHQCHIMKDEAIEPQHISTFGSTIEYDINLPVEAWNTYEKYYVRIYLTCAADVTVSVTA